MPVRRTMLVMLGLAIAARPGFASEDLESHEVLVGWSDDGERFAVVKSYRLAEGANLEVHERDKIVATFKDGDRGVPEAANGKNGVERIDVRTWKPLAKYKLAPIAATARKRFADAYTLAATGKRITENRCTGGGFTITSKGNPKDPSLTYSSKVANDHCFSVLGGYLDPSGKRVLVKLREHWVKPSGSTETETKLVFVELAP